MPLHDRHFVLPTYLPYQIPHSRCHFSRQRWSPILRRPDYVQDPENRVGAVSIFLHPQTLSYCQLNVLKLSPKGEGFNPPKWDSKQKARRPSGSAFCESPAETEPS